MQRTLITHLSQLATPQGLGPQRGSAMGNLRILQDAAIYIEDGTLVHVGATDEVLKQVHSTADCTVIDGTGKCAVPGFVDSHTHFIFGGYRPEEFLMRLKGAAYLDIMRAGGGIQSTVEQTRTASEETLMALGKTRLQEMLAQGVTTVEGKSGYGLDLSCERKQLRVMHALNQEGPVEVVPTYLGGHAVPPEYAGHTDAYIQFMLETVLPQIKAAHLAEFCDVFCEQGVFSVEQSRRLLVGAQRLGFPSKIHADEIEPLGGAELAGELHAVSADHLLRASDAGIAALANNNVVATLLPCTAFCLGKPYAPARKMIDSGCAVALASDFNPGSCFCDSIPLMIALGVIHMGMTIEETLTALTLNGAAAVGRADRIGSLEPGKQADVVLLGYPAYSFLAYHTGANLVDMVLKKGTVVYENEMFHGS